MEGLGRKLQSLRSSTKYTQDDVARLVGVASSTYSGYERNISEPDLNTLKRLANVYNVNIDYLLGNTKIKSSWRDYSGEIQLEKRVVPAGEVMEALKSLSMEEREHIIGLIKSIAQHHK
ncbi:helix-turn-helix domain-containing protein [Massiliimalia massiliensis]|uniref:helix-turn-helix domain-containing protein n=1 Tax=Massiliimalia massiliensis TaxID=1852384 RepID=UPI0009869898|nr:helix-turn-helix transcriptional regulator [Massiliimalia massiliensis]